MTSTEAFPPKNGTPNPGERIEAAWDHHDKLAVKRQITRRWFAVFATVLGPLAVLVLVLQQFVASDVWGIGLIAAEVLALGMAVAIGFFPIGHAHHEWIRHRLLAEILRRERWLWRMRVGPYLGVDGSDAAEMEVRLLEIGRHAPFSVRLLNLEEGRARDWRHELERRRTAAPPLPDLASLQEYRKQRLSAQRNWYADKSEEYYHKDRLYEWAAKAALTVALVIAAIHLGELVAGAGHDAGGGVHGPVSGWWTPAMTVAAILLPPLGAAFVGLRSIFEYHRLGRSYRLEAERLAALEGQLVVLAEDLQSGRREPGDIGLEVRHVVLQTEEVLLGELRQWWIIVHPERPGELAT